MYFQSHQTHLRKEGGQRILRWFLDQRPEGNWQERLSLAINGSFDQSLQEEMSGVGLGDRGGGYGSWPCDCCT